MLIVKKDILMISNTKSIFKSFSTIQWVYFSANIFSVNESAQSFYLCPTLCDPMRLSLSASSVHGIFLARILEQVTISYFRGSSQHRNQTHVCCISCLSRRILYHCTTWEALFRCMCVEKCLEGCMPHDSWGCKESDMTERLNWTELNWWDYRWF